MNMQEFRDREADRDAKVGEMVVCVAVLCTCLAALVLTVIVRATAG